MYLENININTNTHQQPSSLIDNLDTEWKWGELPMPPVATTSNSSPMNSKSSSAVSSAVCSSDEGKGNLNVSYYHTLLSIITSPLYFNFHLLIRYALIINRLFQVEILKTYVPY